MLNRLEDVFASLNRHDVRYLVVGGIAAVLHGVPRATFDLDILIDPTDDNATALLSALGDARRASGQPVDLEDARLLELADSPDG